MGKTVCVIGAGVAGLSAVKSCLEEGLEPKCFERSSDLGGTWHYNESENFRSGRAYESLVTNVSKEVLSFGDFPFPKEFPPFLPRQQIFDYLKSYASHFELERLIEFSTEVEQVKRMKIDGELKWTVRTRNIGDDSQNTHVFDCVMMCVGQITKPLIPALDGLADGTFKGTVMHACDYTTRNEFEGKRVAVVGLASSGSDIASEICGKADKTILSTRSGAWSLPRMTSIGLPMDMTISRFQNSISRMLPEFVSNWLMKRMLDSATNTRALGIRSRFEPLNSRMSFYMNDELPTKIVSGQVCVKPGIIRLEEKKAVFSDGTEEEVDGIIFATGYEKVYPFVDEDILPGKLSKHRLFQWIIPFEIEKPESFAVIGVFPIVVKSGFVLSECQARYAAQLMSGASTLPPVDEMRRSFEIMRAEIPCDGDHIIFRGRLDSNYEDQLAVLGGFYPYFWKLLLRDPRLAFAVHLGPLLGYHFRLMGRHQWSGARERTMNAAQNLMYALKRQDDE